MTIYTFCVQKGQLIKELEPSSAVKALIDADKVEVGITKVLIAGVGILID